MSFDKDADRSKFIGASEAAAILGLHPYRSAWQVWATKTGQLDDNFVENHWTRLGNKLEPVIGDLYEERENVSLIRNLPTLAHKDYPMVAATVDFNVKGTGRIVEAKSVWSPREMARYGEDGSAAYPPHHHIQVMQGLGVTDGEDGHLAAFIGGQLRVYHIARDKALERELFDRLAEWWEKHVVRGEAPPIDASPAAQAWLKHKFPTNNGTMLTADEATAIKLSNYLAQKQIADETLARAEALKVDLIALCADADGVEAPGVGRFTYKKTKDGTETDWEAVARHLGDDDPEELERVVKLKTTIKSGSRRFLARSEKE